MKSFIVNKNDAGQRLDKYIAKSVPALPAALMYRYIRTKRIKVNGKKAGIALKLLPGDLVEMYIGDEFFTPVDNRYDFMTASSKLNIVYEDKNILLLNKTAGLLAHPDKNEYNDTLITRVLRYLYENGSYDPADENSFTPALVNRIDRNTAGLVIAAKNAETLRILNDKMKQREIRKFYLCVIHGKPAQNSGLLEGWLSKDEANNKVKVFAVQKPDSKEIKTKYRVIATADGLSLLEVELLTGRTHQIRAHFAFIGHPLLGDGKYGKTPKDSLPGYKKQFLCSFKLIFDFKSDAGCLDYLQGRVFKIEDVWFADDFPSKIMQH